MPWIAATTVLNIWICSIWMGFIFGLRWNFKIGWMWGRRWSTCLFLASTISSPLRWGCRHFLNALVWWKPLIFIFMFVFFFVLLFFETYGLVGRMTWTCVFFVWLPFGCLLATGTPYYYWSSRTLRWYCYRWWRWCFTIAFEWLFRIFTI